MVYLGVWSLFAYGLSRLSLRQDRTGDTTLSRRMQMISAPRSRNLLSADHFRRRRLADVARPPLVLQLVFGVYFLGGQGIAALAFVILVALYLSRREPMSDAFKAAHFHDYGKLLLAFVMLWTYFALSQLLIIWSARPAGGDHLVSGASTGGLEMGLHPAGALSFPAAVLAAAVA